MLTIIAKQDSLATYHALRYYGHRSRQKEAALDLASVPEQSTIKYHAWPISKRQSGWNAQNCKYATEAGKSPNGWVQV